MSGIIAVLLPISQRPAHFGSISLRPPAIQLGEIDAAIHQDLHPAGTACFPRPPRSVDPDVYTLHEVLRQQHVVVGNKYRMRAHLRATDELHPALNECLPFLIRGVRLSRNDELYRSLRVAQQTQQPLWIVQ